MNPALAERYYPYSMGETAENVAERWSVDRERQDAFALASQQKAVAAIDAGRFDGQIVPITVPAKKGDPVVVDARRASPRRHLGRGAREAPAGLPRGRHRSPRATARGSTTARRPCSSSRRSGRAPSGSGRWPGSSRRPSPASTRRSWATARCRRRRKALERAGIGVDDLDLVELNEAFASQSIVCIDELGLDPDKVNVNGGAIALGHPLGMSGARLITMLSHELRRTGGRWGLATMCIGVGQGIATIIERIDG